MFGYSIYHDRDEGFSIDEALDMLDSDVKMSKKEKYLHKMLTSKDFYGFVFINSNGARKEKVKQLCAILASYDNLKAINNALEDYPIDDYPRTAASFLFSICAYVTNECNEVANSIDKDYHDDVIGRSEKEDRYEDIERKFAYVKRINNEYLNKIIKGYAKKLSLKTGIPREVCMDVIKSIPEKAYIDKTSVPDYLNIITDIIYSGIDEYDDINDIDWDPFFKMIVGDQYIKEVCIYLTAEVAGRIRRTWKNKATVVKIWDSLTNYALETLEELTENDRTHMIDIYKKIVASMSGSSKNDLRVDLTKIDEDVFPKIAKTVQKCYDSIKNAVDTAKGKKDRIKNDGELPSLD